MIAISCYDVTIASSLASPIVSNSWTSNVTTHATIFPLADVGRRAWPGCHCSQSGNMIHCELIFPATTHHGILHSDTPGSHPQCTTGCWCCGSSHPPCHVACITVQLITVSKCPSGQSYIVCTAADRPEPSQPSDRDRLVPDRKWSPRILGDLIAIKCWSRQALIRKLACPVCCGSLSERNSPESWRVADSSCILKWNLYITTYFTNLFYQFWYCYFARTW